MQNIVHEGIAGNIGPSQVSNEASTITLLAYPYPLVKEHFEGTVDDVVNQVRNRLEQIAKNSPDGEKLFGFHAIPDVVISNVKK